MWKEKSMNYVVISNAVIVRVNGEGISYKQKCDSCGLIQGGESGSSAAVINGAFTCTKCKASNKILIKKM